MESITAGARALAHAELAASRGEIEDVDRHIVTLVAKRCGLARAAGERPAGEAP